MKYLSEKITDYVIKTGAASEESYAIYQYGFQILVLISQCIGVLKFKIEKNVYSRE